MLLKVTIPSEREMAAQKSLQTFCTYMRAWHLLLPERGSLVIQQEALNSYRNLQGGAPAKSVQGAFLRGTLTLKLMKQLPLKTHPDLAESANFWAPVQAYYAVHGFGLATLQALAAGNPKDHRHFRSLASAQVLGRLFPFPFNMLCIGNPQDRKACSVENCSSEMDEIVGISNLSSLTKTNAPLLAGKSLWTSRKGFLDELFDKHRSKDPKKGKKRRNLKTVDKQRLAGNLHGTSFIDLLYRLRVRSNYDDPEMFIVGQVGQEVAVEHYRNLVALVEAYALLSGNIIQRKIGRTAYDALIATIPK